MIPRVRLAIMAALIALPVMACAESFRQYIEAEDCALETFGPGQNPLGGYNGGRFVYRIDAEPWTGFIRAPLAATVPPGKLRVFVRGYCSDGELETRTMTVRAGGAEATVKYPRAEIDYKHNWIPFELQTAEPAEDVELQVNCGGGRVIIDTIFVTNDPADGTEFVKRRTRLIRRHQPPAEQTARPEIEGNMLINSSFEVAPTNGWRAGYQSQWALTDESLSEESPFEGDRCLRPGMLRDKRGALTGRWFTYDGIYSSPFQLEAGAIYTASVYVLTDGPISGAIGVKGKTESFELEGSDDWQRVSATVEAPNETDSFYVTFTADGPRELFLDAAQLERGELTDYVPRPGVDVGLSSDQRAGRVWRQGEDMTLAWEVRGVTENAGARVTSIVHDALGRVIHREARQMAAPVEKLATHFANIDPTRAAPWAETAANTRKYDIWAIRSLSWGRAEKWMRYDARYPGPPPGAGYMSIWEHDGSLTPHGVSIATINALIGDAKPLGPVPMPEGMEGHVWSDGARSLLIAWTEDGSSRHLDLPDARAWDVYGGELDAPIVSYLPTFVKFTGEPPEFVAEIAERVTTDLLVPVAEGEPYRARFVAEVTGPAQGECAAAGPYFLQRETTQIIPVEIVEGERAEIVLPLNVWPNLPVKDRLVEVNLYLPGRMLSGALAIDTTDQ